MCDCKDMQSMWQGAATSRTDGTTYSEWQQHVKECIHAQAVRELLAEGCFKDTATVISHINHIHVAPDGCPTVLDPDVDAPTRVSVSAPDSKGIDRSIVRFPSTGKGLATCITCTGTRKHSCKHVAALRDWCSSEDEQMLPSNWRFWTDSEEDAEDSGVPSEATPPARDPVSFEPIPVDRPAHIMDVMANRANNGWHVRPCDDCAAAGMACNHCIASPTPSRPRCSCGEPWSDRTRLVRSGTLVHTNTSWPVQVFERPCSNPACPGVLPYDGQCDAIFNYSNRFLITYEVASQYFMGMLNASRPYISHWNDMCDAYKETGQGTASLFGVDTHRYV